MLLRIGVWAAVVWGQTPAVYDEIEYLSRAQGWAELISQLVGTGAWDPSSWQAAYGQGYWPPLHPLLLAPMAVFGQAFDSAARLVPVVFSVATTPLIFWLGLQIGGPVIARRCAWLHALYPTFIGFSHFLWAESLSAFLLVGLVCAALKVELSSQAQSGSKVRAWSLIGGLLGGLGALAKAPALLFVPVVAWWLYRRAQSRRLGVERAGILLMGCTLLVLPWLWAMFQEEGRWMPLSTLGGFNLALGNHPAVPAGYGSSWGDELSKSELRAWLDREATSSRADWRAVAGPLALDEIRRRPGPALRRAVERLRMMWTADVFLARHLVHGVYSGVFPKVHPRVRQWGAVFFIVTLALLYWILLGFILMACFWGPSSGEKALLILLVLAGSLPPALTLGMPRLHMPMWVLLLPLAAQGLGLQPKVFERGWKPKVKAGLVLTLLLFSISGADKLGLYLNPSSHFGAAVRVLEPWVGPAWASDRVLLRRRPSDRPWRIQAEGEQAAFLVVSSTSGDSRLSLRPEVLWLPGQEWKRLDVVVRAGGPFRLVIEKPTGDRVVFDPIGPDSSEWRDVEHGWGFKWLGGGPGIAFHPALGD